VLRTIFLLFLIVYLLNIIPAFAPPTWMVFSYLGFTSPNHNTILFAVVGAIAATLGRVTLAKLSKIIIRKRLMTRASRENIDGIKSRLERRPKLTAGIFLFYAFTPFPSNYLFIAYGMTGMKLPLVAIPFFLGRTVSYFFWGRFSAVVSRWLDYDGSGSLSYLGIYFVVTQTLFLFLLYAFTRMDWHLLLHEKKFGWIKRTPPPEQKQD
jgi:membrane protein DedA with SNARE-associated domain